MDDAAEGQKNCWDGRAEAPNFKSRIRSLMSVDIPQGRDKTADRDKWLTDDEKAKFLRLERRAAHRKSFRKPKERSSNRLRNTYDQIKQLRATATRRAVDWQHSTTTRIAEQYGTVVVEQLTITNMVKSARGTIAEPGKTSRRKPG